MSKKIRTIKILRVINGEMTSEEIAVKLGLKSANDYLLGRRVRHAVADLAQSGHLEAVSIHKPGSSSRKAYRVTSFGEAFLFDNPEDTSKAQVNPEPGWIDVKPLRSFSEAASPPTRVVDTPPPVIPAPEPSRAMPVPPPAATSIAVGKSAQKAPIQQTNLVSFPPVQQVEWAPEVSRPAPRVESPQDIPQVRELMAPVSTETRLTVLEDRMRRFEKRMEEMVRNLDAIQDAFVAVAAAINQGFKQSA